MGAKIKVIRLGRAAGKTTQLLQKLQEEGGGLFLTRYPQEMRAKVQQFNLDKVFVLDISQWETIAIDDVDTRHLMLATNTPLKLDEIVSPNEKPNPFFPKEFGE